MPDPSARSSDYAPLHAAMQRWVDGDFLAGVSIAVLRPGAPAHVHCVGHADREAGVTLREDHLFRIYSNTKLITSCAVLMLLEEGRLALDDPIERFLPALGQRQVLKPGARSLADVVPARSGITIEQLLTHTSGLSYGLLDPGTLLFKAYAERRISTRDTTLEQMVHDLGALPLNSEPGTRWEYSIATDVLARLVEVLAGMPFDRFVAERIFEPLRMRDTGFVVPERDLERLAAMYAGVQPQNPRQSGLQRAEHLIPPRSHLDRKPRLAGGGGLVSTLGDMVKLLQSLMPSGQDGEATGLLKPATLAAMHVNRLSRGMHQSFPPGGELPGRGHGLAGGIVLAPTDDDHPERTGEFYWGGMAATQWWISARHGYAAALMTQRLWGFGDPFVSDLKREVYRAVLGNSPTGG